jgi:hypothetical protein
MALKKQACSSYSNQSFLCEAGDIYACLVFLNACRSEHHGLSILYTLAKMDCVILFQGKPAFNFEICVVKPVSSFFVSVFS